MSDNKQTFTFDLDAKEFQNKLGDLNKRIDALGSVNLAGLVAGFDKMLPAIGLVTTAVLALKAGFGAIAEGENIKAINQQFDVMAENAGLAGEVIKTDLVNATKGLADDTDVLEAANKVMSKMGASAAKLPEVMEMARKATAVYGGDLVGNFENISNAIANGNGRMLKQYGIIIDNEKAYKDYAASIGSTVGALSEAGKRQAIMNAALEKSKSAFSGVDENVKANQNALKQLMVTLDQIKEIFVVVFEKTFGPLLSKFLGQANQVFGEVKKQATAFFGDWGENAEVAAAQTEVLTSKLTKQQEELRKLKEEGKSWWQTITMQDREKLIKEQELQIIATEGEINGLRAKTKELNEVAKAQKEANDEAVKKETTTGGVDPAAAQAQKTAFEKSLEEARLARIESQEKVNTDVQVAEQLHLEKLEIMNQQYNTKLEEIENMRAQGKITRQQADLLSTEMELEKKAQLEAADSELEQKRMEALQRYAEKNKETAEGFSASWKVASAQAIAANKNFGTMGTQVFQTVNQRAVAAFKAMGDGSKDAGEAMKSFVFGALGEIATMKGAVMLAEGIGTINPLLIAQGGALIALGAMISGMAGAGGGGAAAPATGGGGGATGGGSFSSAEEKPELQEPKKAVNVQIMGNLYETEQTKTRLMEMIREVSDATDFNFSRIG